MYSDAEAAALYNVLNPWSPSDDLYMTKVMAADAVLDVGCGTGMHLHRARESGHPGRLTGIDPDSASLDVARLRRDVEWVHGTAADIAWRREFDLAIMANNAFQCLVEDEVVRDSLVAIRGALREGGRFVFETRNVAAKAWEGWNPDGAMEVVDPAGRRVRLWHEVEQVVDGVVTMTETTGDPDGTPLRIDRGVLRFWEADTLTAFLGEAGFGIESVHGGFTGAPLTPASGSIVVTATA